MSTPTLSPAMITQVSELVTRYILTQRDTYFGRAVPLSDMQKAAMTSFFSPALLDKTRLLVLTTERVRNPEFYPMLEAVGFDNLPNQSTMAAITFSDCVVAHTPFTDPLLFHELVHVEQYRQLGVQRFADLYLKGFLSGGGYYEIPLERNAYALEDRYERDPTTSFSVEEDVTQWLTEGRF